MWSPCSQCDLSPLLSHLSLMVRLPRASCMSVPNINLILSQSYDAPGLSVVVRTAFLNADTPRQGPHDLAPVCLSAQLCPILISRISCLASCKTESLVPERCHTVPRLCAWILPVHENSIENSILNENSKFSARKPSLPSPSLPVASPPPLFSWLPSRFIQWWRALMRNETWFKPSFSNFLLMISDNLLAELQFLNWKTLRILLRFCALPSDGHTGTTQTAAFLLFLCASYL